MIKISNIIVIVFGIILGLSIFNPSFASQIEEFEDYYTITFPKGSYFTIVLEQPIDSYTVKEDDLFESYLPLDIYVGNLLVIPNGSKVIGRVSYLEKAHQGRNALINFQFVAIVPIGGLGEVPIVGKLVDKNPDGSIGGQLTNRTKVKRITHYIEGIGAINQAVPTGPRKMGEEVFVPAGERWIIALQEPAIFYVYKNQ